MAELVQYYGTGRRKTAIARVYLRPGSGEFKVNGRAFEEYFVTPAQRSAAKSPLASTETAATFNVIANVLGGGVRGQADAVKLGLARALMLFNAELRKKLKGEGMVSRDSRGKERKKYGQKGARKRFQFSKRYSSPELRVLSPELLLATQDCGLTTSLGVQFFPSLAARGREWQSGKQPPNWSLTSDAD